MTDPATIQRRIFAMRDVQRIAREIWSWGPGDTVEKSLEQTILCYGDFRCTGNETVLTVLDFIADHVPGGLQADLFLIGRDELRGMMERCIEAAKAEEANPRFELQEDAA